MQLSQLSIAKRLSLVLGLILALSLLSSLLAIHRLRGMNTAMREMLDDQIRTERLASDWYLNTYGGVQRTIAIARSSDTKLADYLAPAAAESVRKTNEIQKQLEGLMSSKQEKDLYASISEQRKAYLAARDAVYQLKKDGEAERAAQVFSEKFEPTARDYMAAVESLMQLQRQQLDQNAAEADEMQAQTSRLLILTATSALGLGVLLAWALSRSITRPLHEAEGVAEAIANMDLSGQPRASYSGDETGRLLRSLDAMRTALSNALGQVREAAENVSTASSQIATGNADLSSRTEEAASNLEETAGAMEQLTGTVRHTADSARTAGQLAVSASEAAEQGGETVRQVVATMDEISAESHKIGSIVGLIDSIAFQTNILALNAAVEAARAGEQGRGFAVVAGEVRVLARRSADAAREIKALIGSSVDKVEQGVQLAERAGHSMEQITGSVRRVSDIIGEIAAGSGEQSQGIGEVNGAVAQLDRMTQQNAALVEEASAAADSLRDQALRLSEVVGGFKLN